MGFDSPLGPLAIPFGGRVWLGLVGRDGLFDCQRRPDASAAASKIRKRLFLLDCL